MTQRNKRVLSTRKNSLGHSAKKIRTSLHVPPSLNNVPKVIVSDLLSEVYATAKQNKLDLISLGNSVKELNDNINTIKPLLLLRNPTRDSNAESLLKAERMLDFIANEVTKRILSSYNVLAYNLPDRTPLDKIKVTCLQACGMPSADCHLIRLRKKSGKYTCPVLFKFSSPNDARKFQSSNKLISSSTPFGNVKLTHDLTPCQRRSRASVSNVANTYVTAECPTKDSLALDLSIPNVTDTREKQIPLNNKALPSKLNSEANMAIDLDASLELCSLDTSSSAANTTTQKAKLENVAFSITSPSSTHSSVHTKRSNITLPSRIPSLKPVTDRLLSSKPNNTNLSDSNPTINPGKLNKSSYHHKYNVNERRGNPPIHPTSSKSSSVRQNRRYMSGHPKNKLKPYGQACTYPDTTLLSIANVDKSLIQRPLQQGTSGLGFFPKSGLLTHHIPDNHRIQSTQDNRWTNIYENNLNTQNINHNCDARNFTPAYYPQEIPTSPSSNLNFLSQHEISASILTQIAHILSSHLSPEGRAMHFSHGIMNTSTPPG
ncbi:unnamed protein product [Trichobilharzia szidati]|nr:unnamed protein product [Trichobilharzia szidati]